MRTTTLTATLCVLMLLMWAAPPAVRAADDAKDDGFKSIFNGKDLTNWDGNPDFWSVQDGAITGKTTAEKPTQGNTFIVWTGGETGDFELKLQYKIIGGNSGIQYRSFHLNPNDKWRIGGYQADFEAADTYSGILYGEAFRGILANRGQKTVLKRDEAGKFSVEVVGSVGDSKEIGSKIKKEDWNEYHIIARGYHFQHFINGVQTIDCVDEDAKDRRATGLLALQLHAGPAMTVQFKDIRLKALAAEGEKGPKADAAEAGAEGAIRLKKVVFIAGRASHGYGSHEHKAGCMLLAKCLEEAMPGYKTEVVTEGWPKDESVLEGAAAIIMYCDGGGGHLANAHIPRLDELAQKGVGIGCLHYGVEVPKGKEGDAMLRWTGGYFEPHWSVNPHWVAKYNEFPQHPVTRGVKPFEINDEWYYHMRFVEEMKGVTPILTDMPPEGTLKRGDGAHSGNPHVRAAVLERKEPQHMMWVFERPEGGGRGFGFTGGHFHWNWGNDEFRQVVLNAIVWIAKGDVPEDGVPVKPLSLEDLEANQDEPQPDNFNREQMIKQLEQWRAGSK